MGHDNANYHHFTQEFSLLFILKCEIGEYFLFLLHAHLLIWQFVNFHRCIPGFSQSLIVLQFYENVVDFIVHIHSHTLPLISQIFSFPHYIQEFPLPIYLPYEIDEGVFCHRHSLS